MKQYQIYFKFDEADGWSYGDTYTQPNVAWAAMLFARGRGCAVKIETASVNHQDHQDHQDVLSVTS